MRRRAGGLSGLPPVPGRRGAFDRNYADAQCGGSRQGAIKMTLEKEKIQAGKFQIQQVGPPKGNDAGHILEDAELVRGRVDAINVTDLTEAR